MVRRRRSVFETYGKFFTALFGAAAGIYLNHATGSGDPQLDVVYVGTALAVLGVPNEWAR